jgi:hypothetical protein
VAAFSTPVPEAGESLQLLAFCAALREVGAPSSMAQIFHPSTNTLSRVSILGAVFFLAGLLWLIAALNRSGYAPEEGVARAQPVQFSHEHHVRSLGIDCRYCHTSVETSAFAGIPPTETCMNCHAYIWTERPYLAPVRESFRTGRIKSSEWQKQHPDVPRADASTCPDYTAPLSPLPASGGPKVWAPGYLRPKLSAKFAKVVSTTWRQITYDGQCSYYNISPMTASRQ